MYGKSFYISTSNHRDNSYEIDNRFFNYENNQNYSFNKVGNNNIDESLSNNKNKVLNKSNYNHDNIHINKVNDDI